MNKLHISDDARQDLAEIKQYIAEDLDSPSAAAHTVKGILKGISRLKEQSARLSDTVNCERLLRAAGSFTLRFLCADPYGYALDDETFTFSQTGQHEVERETGNTDSEPVYALKGTISSGAILLSTNGEALRVVGPLAAGEILVIDTGLVTAKVTDRAGNTLRNGLPCLEELNFPLLRRGLNALSITTEGSAVFTELHIQAKSRWR